MSGSTAAERQVHEMNLLARLGPPVGSAVPIPPAPLKHYAGSIALVVAGVAGLVVPFLLGERRGVMIGFGIPGALCLGVGAFLLYRRGADRASLALFEQGVSLTRFGKRLLFMFDEIEELKLAEEEQLSNGVRQGVRRRLGLRWATGRAKLEHLALDGRPDGVGPVLNALRTRVADACERRLRSGGTLAGKGWVLDAEGLHPRAGAPAVPVPELAEVGLFQGSICVWKGEDERPFVSVPASSANAALLREVVARGLEGKKPREAGSGLGRVLFEKSGSRVVALAVMALGLGAGVVGVITIGDNPGTGALVAILGATLIVGGLAAARGSLRCHQKGVVKRSLLGERVLRYADLEKLTYGATRHYHNGIYTGTNISMKLAPAPGAKPIGFSTTTRGSESDLEMLREHVAGVIAERLHERLAHEAEVTWTGSVRLSPKGIRFPRRKLLGKGPETFAEYADLRYSIDSGTFHLFTPGEKSSVLDLSCSVENFYPGFALLSRLASEAQEGLPSSARRSAAPL